jgi:hypothetical protein
MVNLETVAEELMDAFSITAPPIPIERILQNPQTNMWDDVDLSRLSGSFLKLTESYSPRMSLARMLARHVASCAWGAERGLSELDRDDASLYRFARMLIMPSNMILQLSQTARTPHLLSTYFEVPEEDATLRLKELEVGKP